MKDHSAAPYYKEKFLKKSPKVLEGGNHCHSRDLLTDLQIQNHDGRDFNLLKVMD